MKITTTNLFAMLLLLVSSADAQTSPIEDMTPLERAEAGKALWEEKCRTVAGEKIYKTVPDVEGIVLLKVRPEASQRQWADPMWPGAAFAREGTGEHYINTFLGYEEAFGSDGKPRPITSEHRGYINTSFKPAPKVFPGYRYVDVIHDEGKQRYRYVLTHKPRPTSTIGWIDTVLEKSPAPEPSPRYGVTYEDHVTLEDRALGIASSTVKVIDLQTGEVLGEMLRYAWSTPASRANPNPWLTAYKCPGHSEAAGSTTRMFVDQVLIPRKEQ